MQTESVRKGDPLSGGVTAGTSSLGISWLIPPSSETEPGKVERALRERIKELNCLYAIAQLAERHPKSISSLLQAIVGILPPSWQYPEITEARIRFEGGSYQTSQFRITRWKQSAAIRVNEQIVGAVTVIYREACPTAFEGPFMREERALIEAVAERIGTVAARMRAEQQLQESNRQLSVERRALRESNMALREVLARIEDEKTETHRNIQSNVEKILMPIIHELEASVPDMQRRYVELLRDNLGDLTSPFIRQLWRNHRALTPTEIRICDMIRNGMRSKEIARVRGVSMATVHRQREAIRRKLGLANTAVNLTSYLQSTIDQQ